MTLGNKIAQLRRSHNITQDGLAQQLGVTNQAVSKWESDQCCPDVMLLPEIADIFDVSVDTLFDRKQNKTEALPWPDDQKVRVAIFVGRRLQCGGLPNGEYAANGIKLCCDGTGDSALVYAGKA